VKGTPVRPNAGGIWATLQRIEANAVPGVRRAFLSAIRDIRASLPLDQIENALLRRDTDAVLGLIPLDVLTSGLTAVRDDLDTVVSHSFTAASRATAVQANLSSAALGAAGITRLGGAFDHIPSHTLQAIQTSAADRITGISEETRAAVRNAIEQSYVDQRHPSTAAKEIQRLVGLTQRQADSITKLRAAMTKQGATPAAIDKAVDRKAAAMLKQRASNIAKSEAAQAANDGQRAAWTELQHDGLLYGDDWEREWLTIEPCPICAPYDGQRAPIDGTYDDGVIGPPLHPACECSEALVEKNS
jgi:hypothetical protein